MKFRILRPRALDPGLFPNIFDLQTALCITQRRTTSFYQSFLPSYLLRVYPCTNERFVTQLLFTQLPPSPCNNPVFVSSLLRASLFVRFCVRTCVAPFKFMLHLFSQAYKFTVEHIRSCYWSWWYCKYAFLDSRDAYWHTYLAHLRTARNASRSDCPALYFLC